MLAPVIRGVTARLTENSPNFHQATIFFAASKAPEDSPTASRASLLFLGSTMMVLMQTLTAMGVLWGVVLPSCSDNEQCAEGHAGTYCSIGVSGMGNSASRNRCDFCGRWVPLEIEFPTTGGTMNWAEDPQFVGFNLTLVAEVCVTFPLGRRGTGGNGGNEWTFPPAAVASWCEACVRAVDGTVDSSTQTARISLNVSAMNRVDWIALVFATFVVACKVVGELKDVELCAIQVEHLGDELSHGWRRALAFLDLVRRRMFLPMLVTTVPVLVMLKGGDVSD